MAWLVAESVLQALLISGRGRYLSSCLETSRHRSILLCVPHMRPPRSIVNPGFLIGCRRC
jgi:hypothetical protein